MLNAMRTETFVMETAPVLFWKGHLSRDLAVELRKELLGALRGAEQITVNLAAIESFDVSCLLLLCAAKRYADSMGQILLLEGTENPAITQVVKQYDYGSNSYCLAQCNGRCLWANTSI